MITLNFQFLRTSANGAPNLPDITFDSNTPIPSSMPITQGLDTDRRESASQFMLQALGTAAEFEGFLIIERSRVGQAGCRQAYESRKVGKAVHGHSGKNQPPHRSKKCFYRQDWNTVLGLYQH